MHNAFRNLSMTNLALGLLLAAALTMAPPRARGQQADTSPLEDLFGGKVDLQVGKGGTIHTVSDTETGELKSMIAKKQVTLRTDSFNIDCETLTYDAKKQLIIADGGGKPVRISRDDMTATCHYFEYYPQEDKGILTGNPVMTRPAGIVKGEKITLIQKDGEMQLIVDSGGISGGDETQPTPTPTPARTSAGRNRRPPPLPTEPATVILPTTEPEEKTPKVPTGGAVRIRRGETDRIPEPSLDDEEF